LASRGLAHVPTRCRIGHNTTPFAEAHTVQKKCSARPRWPYSYLSEDIPIRRSALSRLDRNILADTDSGGDRLILKPRQRPRRAACSRWCRWRVEGDCHRDYLANGVSGGSVSRSRRPGSGRRR
jgi:hypothetical protein